MLLRIEAPVHPSADTLGTVAVRLSVVVAMDINTVAADLQSVFIHCHPGTPSLDREAI
jgi:hypothetical protein